MTGCSCTSPTAKAGKRDIRFCPQSSCRLSVFIGRTGMRTKRRGCFQGDQPGEFISTSSARRIFRDAKKKIGLTKPVTLHGLRHAFATHLLELGVDLRYIQVLLGHAQISTTTIYSQVRESQFKKLLSPLEVLGQKLPWLPPTPLKKGDGKAA